MMRTLWPNSDREDALDTVLEVPIPEELFIYNKHKSRQIIKSWMTTRSSHVDDRNNHNSKGGSILGDRDADLQFLLGVIGAPLVPIPIICSNRKANDNIKGHSMESSMARYIVQQYIAASGGEHALNSINSMYAMGKVKMTASEFVSGEETTAMSGNSKVRQRLKNMRHGTGELGGFVLWQKRPDLWSLELMVSGFKVNAGCDGKTAWRQTPRQHSYASRGPPRPTRRSLQGLDPRSTANLFSNSTCIGEKTVNSEDCFVLKLEADSSTLRARSSANIEIIRHTVWGCFSQRSGLLVQLEDTHLLRIKTSGSDVLWETTMESSIRDYRTIEGVNIAHGGRTCVSLFRFGEDSESHRRTRMEEIWSIEEVDFNVKGLVKHFFLPPSDLKREDGEGCDVMDNGSATNNGGPGIKASITANPSRKNNTKVVAIDEESMEMFGRDGGDDDRNDL